MEKNYLPHPSFYSILKIPLNHQEIFYLFYYLLNPHAQHVTMNINMNMQPMFMNINLTGSNQHHNPYNTNSTHAYSTSSSPVQISLSDPITLDLKPAAKQEEKKSSWVDEWK